MTQAPTPKFILNGANFTNTSHGNKGYATDENGAYLEGDVHMGYVWTFRCDEFPRLSFNDHIMHPAHDRPEWRVWCVDGAPVADLDAACRALLCPPLLTLPEYVVLERIGEFPCEYHKAIDMAAGAVNPTPNFIDGIWSRVSRVIDSLRDKGILKYNDGNLEIRT